MLLMKIDISEEVVQKYNTAEIVDWASKALATVRLTVEKSEKDPFTFGVTMTTLAQLESVLKALSKKLNVKEDIKQL